jgi:ankyrin repeat protein
LHIAIIYGSFEAVKLLIENGANINERASGRFFLPEDQKKGRTKDTNYEGL